MVLVTGATGYAGGRLVPRLLEAGSPVRVLARDPARLAGRSWAGRVETVRGDVLDPATLPSAFVGVDVAHYLVHSMGDQGAFATRDVEAARAFAEAARSAGVKRIVYLGGLGDAKAGLSDHLKSRQDTGDALRGAGVPVTEFRAAVGVGSGIISFEMIRWLVERWWSATTRPGASSPPSIPCPTSRRSNGLSGGWRVAERARSLDAAAAPEELS
jgi:uncharacterized protein YbjT (DUF2867 family)